MAQSLSQIYVHLVFHVKQSPINREHLKQLWAYITGIIRKKNCFIEIVGGEPDHVHILCTLPRTESVSQFIEDIKRETSKWIKTVSPIYKSFSWQRGYAIYSISQSKVDIVRKYIANQEEHHKKVSFKDEYVQWLKEYGVEYDEKYLWTD